MKTILSQLIRGLALWLQRYQPQQPQQEGLNVPIPLQEEFERLCAIEAERLPRVTWRYDCGLRHMSTEDMQALFGQVSPVELFPLLFSSWIFFLQRVQNGSTVTMRYSTLLEEDGMYWIQVSLGDKSLVFSIHSTTPLEELADTLGTIGEHHDFRFQRQPAEEKGFRLATFTRLTPTAPPQTEPAGVQAVTAVTV